MALARTSLVSTATAMELYETDRARLDADNLLSDPVVVQKYQTAAAYANEAMRLALAAAVPGASVCDICRATDAFIQEQTAKVFTKNSTERGISFPTCISVNEIACNYTPLQDDPTGAILQQGDVVKVELGVHIDGYTATLAHTIILAPTNTTEPITGKTADVVCAAYYAAEAAVRLIKSGNTSAQVVEAINTIAAAFDVNPLQGTSSHMIKRYLLESEQAIPNAREDMSSDFLFGVNEVYSVNILMSTGSGTIRESPIHKTTLLQRDVATTRNFKLKAARSAFNAISTHFGVFPFSLRGLIDLDPLYRMGIQECCKSDVILGRPVLMAAEGPGEIVAQFKVTVMITANGTVRLTGSFSPPFVQSAYSIDGLEQIKQILKTDVRVAKAKMPVAGSSSMEE